MEFFILNLMFLVFLAGLVAIVERMISMPKLNSANGWATGAFGCLLIVCMYTVLLELLEVTIYG